MLPRGSGTEQLESHTGECDFSREMCEQRNEMYTASHNKDAAHKSDSEMGSAGGGRASTDEFHISGGSRGRQAGSRREWGGWPGETQGREMDGEVARFRLWGGQRVRQSDT